MKPLPPPPSKCCVQTLVEALLADFVHWQSNKQMILSDLGSQLDEETNIAVLFPLIKLLMLSCEVIAAFW